MKKILGLDLGVASIGWAYLHESENDTETSQIIGMGSRIVPLTVDAKQNFTKGVSYSPNQERRTKRSARRNLQRYRLRRYKLKKALTVNGLQPDKSLFELPPLGLYGLRDRAVKEAVSLQELGRILYHLNQKRGYKSSRKANNEEEAKGDYLQAISQRKVILEARDCTIGQYILEELKANERFRVKQKIFPRECYVSEFDKIWELQAKSYPAVLTDKLRREIRDNIIFYQRPLKSQKASVSNCRFEQTHKVSPKSSPIFQVFKVWQNINAIGIENLAGESLSLTIEQKKGLFEVLNDKEKLSANDAKKILGLTPTKNYTLNFEKIETNRTRAVLRKAFDELQINRPELLDFDPYDNPDNQPLFRLWHVLYSIDEPAEVVNALQRAPFGFTLAQAEQLAKIGFKADFGNVSARAIRKILPHLEKGLVYSDACREAGYNHSDSKTKEENLQRILADKLSILPKNELRSPTVEKIVNQVINLVNAILEDPTMGRPDEIRVELGRELKQNAEKRNQTFKNNNERNKIREADIEYLKKEYNLRKVTGSLIERYELWKETGGISIYTGNPIEIAAVLNGTIDVEHIIPKARIFDDSFLNKTLCERHLNEKKSDMTALDFMTNEGEVALAAYQERIARLYASKNISKAKRERLLMTAADIPEGFVDRQIRETQYISRVVRDMLTDVCYQVHSSAGGITAHLRHVWGLEEVLKNLNFEKYEAADRGRIIEGKKVIDDWSKRDDHRHHAIDALVVACTKPAYIQKLNKLNQQIEARRELKEKAWIFPMPWVGFVADAQAAVAQILVSFKSGKRVATRTKNPITGQITYTPRGTLHKETVFGKIQYKGKDEYVVKYKLDGNFKAADTAYIVDEGVKRAVVARLAAYNNDPKKAFQDLDNNPIWFNEAQGIAIKAARCLTGYTKLVPLHIDSNGVNIDFVNTGNNHHVAIYEDENNKKYEEVITLWEAVERLRNGMPIIKKIHEKGWKLVLSMQQNEMFVIGLSAEDFEVAIAKQNKKLISKHLYRVQKISTKNYFFRHHLETKSSDVSEMQAKKIGLIHIVQSLDSLENIAPIKVKINALGQIVNIPT